MNSSILKNKLFNEAFTGKLFGENKKNRKEYDSISLPDDWSLVKLSELGTITSSKRVFQSEWTKSGVPFYRARDIVSLNKGNAVSNVFISEKMYEDYSKKYGIPKVNDILITGVGTIGESYIVKEDDRFYFKDGNIIWFKNNGSVSAEYLKLFFESPVFYKQMKQTSKGSTVLTLTITNANEILVPLPNLDIQNMIVNKLSCIKKNIFELNKKQKKLIKYKSLLKKVVLKKIITDANYPTITLKELIDSELIGDGDWILSEDMCSESNNKLIQIGSIGTGEFISKSFKYISDKKFIELKCSEINEGDLLISRFIANDKLNACIVPKIAGRLLTSVDVCWIKEQIGVYDNKYLMYCLLTDEVQKQILLKSSGTTRMRISKGNLIKIKIPVPSIDEQKQIVNKIDSLMKLIEQI